MNGIPAALKAHLAGGVTTVCRAWEVRRRDGAVLCLTDHDRDLAFDGRTFLADRGMSAAAVQQTSGLAVDNSEAAGVLTSDLIREADIAAGRYDGAGVTCWLVNWAETGQRAVLFAGSLGEVTRAGGGFRAELRGLSEALNRPQGRVFQAVCDAVLGDLRCGVDLAAPGFSAEAVVGRVREGRILGFPGLDAYDDRWFERGRLRFLDGAAAGLVAVVKNDRPGSEGERWIELWERPGAGVVPGDRVRLEAGCDKRVETCRLKFGNLARFRGFPHIPGEDWLSAVPWNQAVNAGGSRGGAP